MINPVFLGIEFAWGPLGAGTIREKLLIGPGAPDLFLDCAVIGQSYARPAHGRSHRPALC